MNRLQFYNFIRFVRYQLLILFTFFHHTSIQAQCAPIANAVPDITLTYTAGGGTNASGVAYNPTLNLYYTAIAGNTSYPLETYDIAGNPLSQTNTGFDIRGLWWNFNLGTLESNGFNTRGIWSFDLNPSGYALNTGTQVFAGNNQPNSQSVGDFSCSDDEIWYYMNGSVMKRDRTTNALKGSFAITGLPVGTGNLNSNTVFFTDCLGHEIGVLDRVLKRVYFINKTTMAYAGMSQLPTSAVTNNSFRASWANDMVWLYNTSNRTWSSYRVLSDLDNNCTILLSNTTVTFTATPLDDRTIALKWATAQEKDNDYFTVERSFDAIHWEEVSQIDGAGNSTSELNYQAIDPMPYMNQSYYRLKQTGFDQEINYSDIETVHIQPLQNSINIYPNPSRNNLVIEGDPSAMTSLNVYNSIGQNITNKTNVVENSPQRLVLDISNLAAGNYLIKTNNSNKKITKIHE